MRECHRNYAHGPMKLMTREILVDYRGVEINCEETFYGCTICDFELHLGWMKGNMQQNLAAAYENLKDAP